MNRPSGNWLRGAIVLAFVLLIRLPFLNQAIQGDDIYYLAAAQHAQIDPLHPNHTRYVFNGDMVDMRGHPHPPLDGWVLGLLLAIFGDIREMPFHAAFLPFSLLAAWGAWRLARRFSPRPLVATLLFLATPAFVVNGTSLETDLPLLAFWLAGIALFVAAVDRESWPALALSAAALALAAMAAYQAVLATPILAVYLWRSRKRWRAAWAVVLAAPAAVLAWQLFERISSGALPATLIAGYFQTYGPQNLFDRLRNAAALTTHAGWLIFPALAVAAFGRATGGSPADRGVRPTRVLWIVAGASAVLGGVFLDENPLFWASFGIGILLIGRTGILVCVRRERDELFLTSWILLFFSAALVMFFAGSARYLLPIALPVAILATRLMDNPRWLWAGFALALPVSLSLAVANYQHWDGYRQFARSMERESRQKRVWINGEWGLRYYFEADGGLALARGQAVQPGEMLVSSRLAFPIAVTTGGGVLTPVREQAITSVLPFRLIGLGARSAYSTDALGLRPFDICRGPIDVVSAAVVVERKPELSWLPMNAPQAGQQIVSGMYGLEANAWRWMSGRAVVLLKNPGVARPLDVVFLIPGPAPARHITVQVDGHLAAEQTYPGPGTYTLSTPPLTPSGATVTVAISVNRTFTVPGDQRQLGMILSELGFRR